MSSTEPAVAIACRVFGLTPKEALHNSREVAEADATYFWSGKRGGGGLLVARDLSALFANSSVPFDVHVAAFVRGERTDADLLG